MPLWQPSAGIAKPAYYDRKPAVLTGAYNAVNTPHGDTIRVSMTSSIGFQMFIEILIANVTRSLAAGAASEAYSLWQYVPIDGVAVNAIIASITTNVPADRDRGQLTQFGVAVYGDLVQLHTADSSTGGAVRESGWVKGDFFLL